MTKRIRYIVTGFLVLSFCLAGLVSISPVLHVTIEHGGRGPAHTHRGTLVPRAHSHADPSFQQFKGLRCRSELIAKAQSPGIFVSTHQSFALPTLNVKLLWNRVIAFLEGPSTGDNHAGETANDSDPSSHTHHSLPQSIACGLLEHDFDATPFKIYLPEARAKSFPTPVALSIVRLLDKQTAGRAPPRTRS